MNQFKIDCNCIFCKPYYGDSNVVQYERQFSKIELIELANTALASSGPFQDSKDVHALAKAVLELLK